MTSSTQNVRIFRPKVQSCTYMALAPKLRKLEAIKKREVRNEILYLLYAVKFVLSSAV